MKLEDRDHYFLGYVGSHERAALMYEKMSESSAEEAQKWFVANWVSCDSFYHVVDDIRDLLVDFNFSAERLVFEEDREWWDALPNTLHVYRGCEEGRDNGLSWTLDRSVAETFAQGHRGLRLSKPRIYEKTVYKTSVYFATNERAEQEIIV
ncbi:hypothetical protein [Yoonia sp.]|uniref:hypothetical protein n=1 Tax=Yoonia sp. TaxID=2212373 RepID=UPI003F71D19F